MVRSASLALLALASVAPAQSSRIGSNPPKLVVVISIDQYRADYIERFAPYYLPPKSGGKLGGFRFLTETGAWYRDAHHNHLPTATGPGHATLLTGSEPTLDGIVGNNWFDRAAGKGRYVTDDSDVESVGGPSGKMSPKPLLVTTVGDELKMATNGRSKVVGIAFKDRAAILMAGHAADTVIWLDSKTGSWETSTWYAPSGKLPAWVEAHNTSKAVDKGNGIAWEPLLPADAYAIARRAPAEKPSENGKVFSHMVGKPGAAPDRDYYGGLWTSAFGNEFLFDTVKKGIEAEKLGQHDVPDLLCINLSTNDYVGHRFGPNSPEVQDISVRTDRLLSDLFNYLNKQVGIDKVAVVLTADHGVVPIPEEVTGVYKGPGGRQTLDFGKTIGAALEKKFGAGSWVLGSGLYEQNFYINRETAAAKNLSMEEVEKYAAEVAMKQTGVYMALTRTQILTGNVPNWPWVKLALNGFHPTLGGDLMIIEAPGYYFGGGTGTGHGSAWDFDSHVPIVMRGPGLKPGKYTRRVATADIASTLCHLLGIEYPTGNVGLPLSEALDK